MFIVLKRNSFSDVKNTKSLRTFVYLFTRLTFDVTVRGLTLCACCNIVYLRSFRVKICYYSSSIRLEHICYNCTTDKNKSADYVPYNYYNNLYLFEAHNYY